jgi:hypothetical protein
MLTYYLYYLRVRAHWISTNLEMVLRITLYITQNTPIFSNFHLIDLKVCLVSMAYTWNISKFPSNIARLRNQQFPSPATLIAQSASILIRSLK